MARPTPDDLWERSRGDTRLYVGWMAHHGYLLNSGAVAVRDPLYPVSAAEEAVGVLPPLGVPIPAGSLYPSPALLPGG